MYVKTNWRDGDLIAENGLNNLEDGVFKASQSIEALTEYAKKLDTANASLTTALDALSLKVSSLEDFVRQNNTTQVEADTDVSTDKDISIIGQEISENRDIYANSIYLANTDTVDSFLSCKANNSISIKKLCTEGTIQKSVSNASLKIRNNGTVTIQNSVFGAKCYNGAEIALPTDKENFLPTNIFISDTYFDECSNNAISIFEHSKNASITISNCRFKKVSNVLRLSNVSNVPAVIIFINCYCEEWDIGEYAGMLVMQDYTSKTAEEAIKNNRFANLTIRFIDCYGPYGRITEKPLEEICGSQDSNQLMYIYSKEGIVPYSKDRYPKVLYE